MWVTVEEEAALFARAEREKVTVSNLLISNAHRDPHLVAGDAAIMAWYDDGVLDRDDALAIAKHLDRPRKMFGVSVQIKDLRWDAAKKERVHVGYKDASVWHCSLSMRAEEGPR